MRVAWLLFAFGLVLRVLFWLGGPDGGLGWHVGLQGDAPVWQDQALRLANGTPDAELLLPWRSPGMLWFVSALWDGGPVQWPVRLLFVVAGAAVAPLCWLLLRQKVDGTTAVLAAAICGASSNLLLTSAGLHANGLYLALALLGLCDQARLSSPHSVWLPLRWGALHGLVCLVRSENVLVFVVLAVVAKSTGVRWRSLLLAAVACAAVIAPWQVEAARRVTAFQDRPPPPPPPLSLPWEEAARERVRELPSFAQRTVWEVVDATVRHRGGTAVRAPDLEIVREAFGCWPERLPVPLIALYGPYNFFLANSRESTGYFSRAAYDRDPPLSGGADRYPASLRLLPGQRRRFSLGHPPHLAIALHGYRLGLEEMLADPGGTGRRLLRKLWQGLAGATGGIGGYALPIGLSGQRRPVDLVAPEGAWAAVWRCLVLAAAAVGLFRLRRNRGLWPLFAFAAISLAVLLVFFGHARHGVTCVPVVALGVGSLLASALRRWPRLGSARLGLCLLAALVALEGWRAATVTATVDGQPVGATEPFPANDFSDREVRFH